MQRDKQVFSFGFSSWCNLELSNLWQGVISLSVIIQEVESQFDGMGKENIIHIDHKPLQYLQSMSKILKLRNYK
jgi:hypothetical protein